MARLESEKVETKKTEELERLEGDPSGNGKLKSDSWDGPS